jgi:hypothetical protein
MESETKNRKGQKEVKFIPKPRVITAQQFILGQPLPEGVKFHESCANPDAQPGQSREQLPEGTQNPVGCSLDGRYYVRRTEHQNLPVQDGDWIVPTFENLYFDVIKPDVMERDYQTVIDDPEAAVGLTGAAYLLRVFLKELGHYLGGVSAQLRVEHKESEANTVQSYANRVNDWLLVPYSDFIPKERCPNCGWDGESVEWSGAGGNVGEERVDGSKLVMSTIEANPEKLLPPDIRTLDGALRLLDHHNLTRQQQASVNIVNKNFQTLVSNLWESIPEGPAKTLFIRALDHARNAANSAISNKGA